MQNEISQVKSLLSKRRGDKARTRSAEDERQMLIALTPQGHALREKAKAVPMGILSASGCTTGEMAAMKNDLVALRDRLNAALGE